VLIHRNNPGVRYRNTVGVAPQVVDHSQRTGKSRFCVGVPLLCISLIQLTLKIIWRLVLFGISIKFKEVLAMILL
jgi:hypothetical protein